MNDAGEQLEVAIAENIKLAAVIERITQYADDRAAYANHPKLNTVGSGRIASDLRGMLAAADTDAALKAWHAKQHEGEEFILVGDWLAVSVGHCTCGMPAGAPYGHEPMCGTEPVEDIGAQLREVRAKALDAFGQFIGAPKHEGLDSATLAQVVMEAESRAAAIREGRS